jgi:nucleotide-binding universal stress UspA family protein
VQNTIIVAAFVALLAAFVPLDVLANLTSMGTLVAFAVVSAGVMILRRTQPDLQWRAQAVEAQRSVLAELPRELRVETAIGDGPDWKHALSSLPWEDGEVLVLGSSSRSAAVRALLGGDATRIVRSSPVPVIVIPRGVAACFAESDQ